MTDVAPYSIPKEPGRWRALLLAALVHAALLALLWVGIRWQSETPLTVEAEIWSPQIREAAPRPPPAPEVKPEPRPVVQEKPKPAVVEPPVAKPDIALEQEKKRKAQEAKEREAARIAKEKEQKALEIAKQKAEAEKQKKLAEAKAQQLADAAAIEKMREEEMRKIANLSGAGGSGDAPKAQSNRSDPSYIKRLSAKIKSYTTFVVPPDLRGNPPVEYTVELFPDGSVKKIKKIRASQLPGFDEAVERAINDAAPYPADKSGKMPNNFNFSHYPKDE